MNAQDAPKIQKADLTELVSRPSCRHCPDPDYTAEARRAKIKSARVPLAAMISEKGDADDIRVLIDPGYGLGEKAVKAVKKWKFNPATRKDGKPVPARATIEIVFRSSD